MEEIRCVQKKEIYTTHDLEILLVGLDLKIEHRNEIVQHLERVIPMNKLKICNSELMSAKSKINDQEDKIKSLRCRIKRLEKMAIIADMDPVKQHQADAGVFKNEISDHVIEQDEWLVKRIAVKEAEMSKKIDEAFDTNRKQEKKIQELTEEINTLKSERRNRNIETAQLEFRNRLLDDASGGNKLCLDKHLLREVNACDLIQELKIRNAYLKREIERSEKDTRDLQTRLSDAIYKISILEMNVTSLQNKNKENESEIFKARLQMKNAEIRESNTCDKCQKVENTLNTLHSEIKELDKRIKEKQKLSDEKDLELNNLKHVWKAKEDELRRKLYLSLKNEAILSENIDLLNKKIHEKEHKIFHLNQKLDDYLEIFTQREAEIGNRNNLLRLQIIRHGTSLKRRTQEIENKEGHLDIKHLRMETESRDDYRSIQQQLRNAEIELAEHKRHIEQEKKQARIIEIHVAELVKELEYLNIEIKESNRLHVHSQRSLEQKEETETKVNEFITKRNKQHLQRGVKKTDLMPGGKNQGRSRNLLYQEEFNQSHDKDIVVDNITNLLHDMDVQMSNLKHQISRNFKTVDEREVELRQTNYSLQVQLKDTESELDKRVREIEREKSQLYMNKKEMTKMSQEIKLFHIKMEEKETELKRLHLQLHDLLHLKEEAEEKLNEAITEHTKDMNSLRSEIRKRNVEISKMEKEKHLSVGKSVNLLKLKNQEKDNQIIELGHQLSNKEQHLKEIQRENASLEEHYVQAQRSFKMRQETEEKMDESIKKQTTQLQQLHEEMEQRDSKTNTKELVQRRNEGLQHNSFKSYEKETTLEETIPEILLENQEKDAQISELSQQLNRKSEKLTQTEAELRNTHHLLQLKMKNAERDMKQSKQEYEYANNQSNKTNLQMSKDIECLKSELNEKDETIKVYLVQSQNALKLNDDKESNLKGKIDEQSRKIQDLQREIAERAFELKEKERELSQYKEHQETHNHSLKEKDKYSKAISVLEMTNRNMSDQIVEFKKQVNGMTETLHLRERDLMESSLSLQELQKKLKSTETELEQSTREIKIEKELSNNLQEQMKEITKEIKSLKLKEQENERELQDQQVHIRNAMKQKENTEKELNDIIKNQKREIELMRGQNEQKDSKLSDFDQVVKHKENYQQELLQSRKREALLDESIHELRSRYQENEDERSHLKQKLKKQSETFHQRETELKNQLNGMTETLHLRERDLMDTSLSLQELQKKLQSTETELEQSTREIKIEKALSNNLQEQMKENTKETKSLKLKVQENERELQNHQVHIRNAMKQKENTEKELNDIIKNQKREIELMRGQNEQKDSKLSDFDQVVKHKENYQQELLQSRKREALLDESIHELRSRYQENEDERSHLKQKLKKQSETFHQRETELQNAVVLLQRKLEKAETEVEQCQQESKQEKDQSYRTQKVLNEKIKEIEHLKPEVNRLNEFKETSLQRETKFENMNLTLNMQIKSMEEELKEYKLAISHVKQQESSVSKLNIDIECLKKEVEKKETAIHDYNVKYEDALKQKEKIESKLTELTNRQSREIQHLQGQIDIRGETVNVLRNQNEENENQISELKQQLNEIQEKMHQRESELLNENISLQEKLKNAERDVKISKQESKHEKDRSNKAQEQMNNEIEKLKQEVYQMNEISQEARKKEAEWEYLNSSLQMQLKRKETDLKQYKLELSLKKEKESSKSEMNKVIERLELEVKRKETSLQDYKKKYQDALQEMNKTESKLNEVINKRNRQIEYLKRDIDESDIKITKMAALDETVNDLQNRNQEKSNQINELKKKLNQIQETLHQKETELLNTSALLKEKLRDAEKNVEISQQESIQEKEQSYKAQEQMKKQIECLTIEVNHLREISKAAHEKETKYETMNCLLKDAEKEKEEVQSELKGFINKQNKKLQKLQGEIDRKNDEITKIGEVNSNNKHLKQALQHSRESEAALSEANKVLQIKCQQYEDRISNLTCQINETSDSDLKLKNTNYSLQNKIKSSETKLEQLKRKLTNEEQRSKYVQTKMTEMSKEIHDLINEKEMKEIEIKKREQYSGGIINSQAEKIKQLEKDIQEQEMKLKYGEREAIKEVKAMENKMADLNDQLKHTLGKLKNAETELDETKSRLSRVMGDRLTDNNPNITDLSDRNRPTKIAEKCAELYDNQWTDAYDVLQMLFHKEEVVIEVLLYILQDSMTFCKTMAKRQMEAVKREMNFADTKLQVCYNKILDVTPQYERCNQPLSKMQEGFEVSSDMQKVLKDQRKALASSVVGNLFKIYVSHLKQSGDKRLSAALDVNEYTSECIEISWFMVVQDPPVVFGPLPQKGSSFDLNFYKPYTKSGTHVEYSVWPSLLLHEDGPILSKGVAQGYGKR